MRFRVTRKPYNKKKKSVAAILYGLRRVCAGLIIVVGALILLLQYSRAALGVSCRRATIMTIVTSKQEVYYTYRCNISACVYIVVEYIFDAVTNVQTRVIKHFITYM